MNKIYDDRLNYLEKRLNDINVVEGKWYRRNNLAYPNVCYVNNIIALRLSKNFELIPVFIKRIRKFLSSKYSSLLNEEYIIYVSEYLDLVEKLIED